MPATQRPIPRLRMVAGVVVLAVGLAVALDSADAVRPVDLWFADLGMALRADDRDPENILIVALDKHSIATISRRLHQDVPKAGEGLSWPRWVHARVIRQLNRAGAKVIAYNFVFAEPRRGRGDRELVAAARGARRRLVVAVDTVEERTHPTRYRLQLLPQLSDMRGRGLGVGTSKLEDDSDGTFRRAHSQIVVDKHLADADTASVEGFGATVAARFRGVQPQSDREWIAFEGPEGTFDRVSFLRVFDGNLLGESFSGKVALVSSDDPRQKVPVGDRMSSAELEANVIHTFLDGVPIREPNRIVRFLFFVAMALAPVGWLLREQTSVRRGLVVGAAGVVAGTAGAVSLGQGPSIDDVILLPVTYGIAAFLVSAVLMGLLLRGASGQPPSSTAG